ncbi:MAG: outer membrane beta-barrel protein [Syntrophales bacterium]|nr:outer membrane beta-barrel protein [Syntrophales bacterium]
MKRFAIVCVSLLTVFLLSFNAGAQEDSLGIYVGILGGVALPPSMPVTVTDFTDGAKSSADVSMRPGLLAGAKVGYFLPYTKRILAAELEYNHIESSVDTGKQYAGTFLDSKVKADIIMVNLVGRYPSGRLHPYAGVGAGYANVKLNDISGWSEGTKLLDFPGGSQGVFAYQFLAGLDFDITKNWIVGLGYKYLITNTISYTASGTDANGNPASAGIDAQFRSHNVTLTVGYLF